MRKKSGEVAPQVILPGIDGTVVDTAQLKGKAFMLSFFRFAGCPLCNMRLHGLVRRFSEFGNAFTVIAVFDSPLDNLILHVEGHKAPFPILADESNKYYREFGIEHSIVGVFKGMFLRMPTLAAGMLRGYLPKRIKGSLTTMPADFLIDSNGIIQVAYYGSDEGDHLPIERIKEFAHRQ